jgi:hypothetical protein
VMYVLLDAISIPLLSIAFYVRRACHHLTS